jgi:membrane associated rhomboid family serine protease
MKARDSKSAIDEQRRSRAYAEGPASRARPLVTVLVFAATATVNILQLTQFPSLLARLQRSPAGLQGEWWRTFSSLFVQDGGVRGTLSNLAFLLGLGIATERAVSRGRWLTAYFGAGLVGELAGYAWQGNGGGNSVAVCGLAGVVALALCRRNHKLPKFSAPAVLLWCGVLLSTWHYPLIAIGVVAAALTPRLVRSRWRALGTLVVVVTSAVGLTLVTALNIHGAALLAGLVLAVPLTYRPAC